METTMRTRAYAARTGWAKIHQRDIASYIEGSENCLVIAKCDL